MNGNIHSLPIDLIPISIALYKVDDGDFIFIDLNIMAQETEKISKEELLGRKVTEVFPGIIKMGLLDVFKRVYESGESEVFDITRYKDKRISGWRKNTVTKLDENTIMAAYEDVSLVKNLKMQVDKTIKQLKKSTNELQTRTLDLQKAQSLAKIGSWRYEIDKDILTWSDETYIIFQIDKKKHPIKKLNDFFKRVDPDYIEIVNQEYTKHLKDGTPYDITHELILEDGTLKWIQEKCETIYDDGGNPVESHGILQDITQQKELQIELLKDKKLLENAEELAHIGSWEWNIEEKSVTWSDEVFRIFGEAPQSFQPTFELFISYLPEDAASVVKKEIENSLKTKKQYKIFHEIIRADSSKRYLQEIATPFYNSKYEPISMSGTVLDMTDIHNAKLELEKKTKELEKIFNVNPNITILTDGENLIDANDKFFQFTGFNNLNDFKKKHKCICDLFEDYSGYIQAKMNGKDWVSYVIEHNEQVHKALIKKNGCEYIFSIHADSFIFDNNQRNIVVLEDISKLEQSAHTDFLTGLHNRKKMDALLMDLRHNFIRYNRSFSVIMLDIDYFKVVNDTYGHDVGDYVLQEIAKILKLHTREIDFVGRWGGEEFLIVCPETSMDGAYQLAENIRVAIENHNFNNIEKMTASFGVDSFRVNMNIEDVIKGADEALYKAKNSGRNRVVL